MKKGFCLLPLLLLVVCCSTISFSQNYAYIDSLRRILPTKTDKDTTKPSLMGSLAFEYSYLDLDSGMRIAQAGLELANKQNNYKAKAKILNTIGTIYNDQANYKKAIESYTEARKYAELLGDKNMLAVIYANAGNTHSSLGDFKNANYYLFECVKIFKEIKDTQRFTVCYMNIGSLYFDHDKFDSVLYYYDLALSFPCKNKGAIASVHVAKASYYRHKKQYELAEKECLMAIEIAKELKSDYYYYGYITELGNLYLEIKKYDKAEPLLLQALQYSKQATLHNIEMNCHLKLYELYAAKKNYQKALSHHVDYTTLNDSINGVETNKAARELEKKYQNEKKQTEIDKLNAEKSVGESELKRKNQFLLFTSIAVVLILIALGFAINSFINKRKANIELQTLHKAVSIQKNELYDKNKNITDSIVYAQRIQKALLTSHSYIKKHIPHFFIINKPKDIVSGDFYWALHVDDNFYFMLADCTGHGVPGAFMSLLGINFLNELVVEQRLRETSTIVNHLRSEIIHALNDNDNDDYRMNDGMDAVLCRFDLTKLKLHYTAANNKIIVIRDNKIIELKGDKMPIGSSPKENESFTSHEFSLQKDDMLYLFTDGFPDQFGGDKGKKLKEKNLKELLLKYSHTLPHEQEKILIEHFEAWKSELEQVDDVCLIGFKI